MLSICFSICFYITINPSSSTVLCAISKLNRVFISEIVARNIFKTSFTCRSRKFFFYAEEGYSIFYRNVYINIFLSRRQQTFYNFIVPYYNHSIFKIIGHNNVVTHTLCCAINRKSFRFLISTPVLNELFSLLYHRFGEKVPVRVVSRLITISWIIIGLVLISIFLAVLTVALTVTTTENQIILYGTKVGLYFIEWR